MNVRTGEQSVALSTAVKITDPTIRRLTEATREVNIIATGKFKAGTYFLENIPISIADNTTFHLSVRLPVDNPELLKTSDAEGRLKTSKPLSIATLPIPDEIKLRQGHASGQMDLARSMSAFVINIIQLGGTHGSFKEMLDSMTLEKVDLLLKEGKTLRIGEKELKIGADSSIYLENALVSSDLTYTGTVSLNLNFAKGCKWKGEKVDCDFEGGNAKLRVHAKKELDRLVLTKIENDSEKHIEKPILLEQCTIKFGKNKRCISKSKIATITARKFWWQKCTTMEHPTMHLDSSMIMEETDLLIKTDIHETRAFLKEKIFGALIVTIDENDRAVHFSTVKPSRASNCNVNIAKSNTSLDVELEDVKVDSFEYEKLEELKFSLEGGKAKVRRIAWKGDGSTFRLDCGKSSRITIPNEMMLDKPDSHAPTRLDLNLELDMGSARAMIKGKEVNLSNLKGQLAVEVASEIHVRSNLVFDIPQMKMLDGYGARIEANGLTLSMIKGQPHMRLEKCSLIIPDEALHSAIEARIPRHIHMEMDKQVQENKNWRYRNARVNLADIDNLELSAMKAQPNRKISFNAKGDVSMSGTIEKSGIILNRNTWETKPWSLTAKFQGNGEIEYAIEPSRKSGSLLHYNMRMNTSLPDDVELDWSQVAGGILKIAERKSIVGHLRKTSIPIEKSGEIVLFQESNPLSHFVITDLSINDKTQPGAKQIVFTASSQ